MFMLFCIRTDFYAFPPCDILSMSVLLLRTDFYKHVKTGLVVVSSGKSSHYPFAFPPFMRDSVGNSETTNSHFLSASCKDYLAGEDIGTWRNNSGLKVDYCAPGV